jgi:hypothetical protein
MAALRINLMTWGAVMPALVCAIWGLRVSGAFAAPVVEETPLVTLGDGVEVKLGPNNHVAAIVPKGSKMAAVVDGVEGPKVDQFYEPRTGRPYTLDGPGVMHPFLFSEDGSRWAYAARQGGDLVVFHDGKELVRVANFEQWGDREGALKLSPRGAAVYFKAKSKGGDTLFYFNGKEQPAPERDIKFSADETAYVYRVAAPGKGGGLDYSLIVSGESKPIRAVAYDMTSDGKLVAVEERTDESKTKRIHAVWHDDKVVYESAGYKPTHLTMGPNGAWAFTVQQTNASGVEVHHNGQKVATLPQGANLYFPPLPTGSLLAPTGLFFSPDGKRLAIATENDSHDKSVIVDGQSAGEYQSVEGITFTGDSSKVVYFARARNNASFVIIGDEESQPLRNTFPQCLAAAPQGDIVMYYDGTGAKETTVFVNHRKVGTIPVTRLVARPQFSANGKNLYIHSFEGDQFIYLNGRLLPTGNNSKFVINDDGSQWAASWTAELVINGKPQPKMNGTIMDMQYTPDGKHLAMAVEVGKSNAPNSVDILIDGQKVRTVDRFGFVKWDTAASDMRKTWFVRNPDGTLSFLSVEGGVLKRIAIRSSN